MGSGVPIRLRLASTDILKETGHIGEPFLNVIDNKFGIFDGTQMLWYPGIDPVNKRMVMNTGQKITGKDSIGGTNVEISFNTPNALEVVYKPTGVVMARFDQTGASFNNFVNGTVIPGGSINRFTHPGFLPSLFSSTSKAALAGAGVWLGPNTYLWKKSTETGDMSVKYEALTGAGNLTHVVSDTFCLRADVSIDCVASGIRMWMFDPFLGQTGGVLNFNKFYISIIGPIGKTSVIRVGRGGSYSTTNVTATGTWQRIAVDFPTHIQTSSYLVSANEPYAIDVLYQAQAGTWFIQEPTAQCVDKFTTEIYQYRGLAERYNAANMCWYTPHGYNLNGNTPLPINFPYPFTRYNDPNIVYDVETISSTYPVTVSDKTAAGFTATTTTAVSGIWSYVPRIALRGPTTDIV